MSLSTINMNTFQRNQIRGEEIVSKDSKDKVEAKRTSSCEDLVSSFTSFNIREATPPPPTKTRALCPGAPRKARRKFSLNVSPVSMKLDMFDTAEPESSSVSSDESDEDFTFCLSDEEEE